jgi:hypothetical protein
MGKRTQPDTERQPAGRGSQVRGPRRRILEKTVSPYPAVENVPGNPVWHQRLRGVVGMTVLVTVLGVLTAIAFTVLVVLLIVVAVSTIA